MFSIFLAVGLFSGILCGPLPNPSTELLPNERFSAVEPASSTITNTQQETNPTLASGSKSDDEEKLEAQETFYPVGGIWWGMRPWGGWNGYRPWHGPHWGGWGGYRPWHGPHWGGVRPWHGPHWGGHWGRTSS